MADNGAKYAVSDVKAAIEAEGAAPARIAKRLGCSRTTVYGYLRKYPELRRVYEGLKGQPISDQAQYTYEAFVRAIQGSRGIKSAIAARMGCSRGTVENALERWPDLAQMVADERESLVDVAEVKLLEQVNAGELRAILFTLETLGKERGWAKRREVTGADGAPLGLSPEIAQMIRAMGLDVSDSMRQFEDMVKAAAESPHPLTSSPSGRGGGN